MSRHLSRQRRIAPWITIKGMLFGSKNVLHRWPVRIVVAVLAILTGGSMAHCPPGPSRPAIPSTQEMMGWIRGIVDLGIRRPGYDADDKTEQWVAEQLHDLGLAVTFEPIAVSRWEETDCALEITAGGETRTIDCFPVPYSAPTAGIEADLAVDRFDATQDASNLPGRIAVYQNRHLQLPQALMRDLIATSTYDPDNDFEDMAHTLPFGPRLLGVMYPPQLAGAVGFIGIVQQGWDSNQYFVPYDAGDWAIPGVWIAPGAGRELLEQMEAGPVRARMAYAATRTPASSNNVLATLPGASTDWVIIGTHHDGPWASAVEDASGIALVLAQAVYWSQVPQAQRPFNMLFLLTGGHMSGGAGILSFVEHKSDLIQSTVVAIHLEHVAREPVVVDGVLSPGDKATPRWWFTTENEPLENAITQAIADQDLRRSFVLPPTTLGERPPTDGAFFYPHVPIVQLLAAPEYLFDVGDTVEMIHEESLVPITKAVIQVIDALSDYDAAGLREFTREPPEVVEPPGPPHCDASGDGACQSESDCAVINTRNVSAIGAACAGSCTNQADPVVCISQCLAINAGLSPGCTGCYLGEVGCIYGACQGECALGLQLDACTRCRIAQQCYETLFTCGGLTAAE